MGKHNEVIERSQITSVITEYIKSCASRIGDKSNLQLDIRHDDWGNRLNGVWKWISSEIRVGQDTYRITDRQVTVDYFLSAVENALKESGVRGKVFTETYYPGNFTKAYRFSRLEIFAPPCQEFRRLNDILKEHGCKPLSETDIFEVAVCGKRSSWSDSGSFKYLCYRKENCKQIGDLIETICDKKDSLHLSLDEFLDHGDEYSYKAAMYHESEWYGSRGQNLRIVVKDGAGKEKFNDLCTWNNSPSIPAAYVRQKYENLRDAIIADLKERIINPGSRSFPEDVVSRIRTFVKESPLDQEGVIGDIKKTVKGDPTVRQMPGKWIADAIKEFDSIIHGKPLEQDLFQGYKR